MRFLPCDFCNQVSLREGERFRDKSIASFLPDLDSVWWQIERLALTSGRRIVEWRVNQASENQTEGTQACVYSNLRSTRPWWDRTFASLLISFIELRAVMENKVPERTMVTGTVSSHAITIARIVFS